VAAPRVETRGAPRWPRGRSEPHFAKTGRKCGDEGADPDAEGWDGRDELRDHQQKPRKLAEFARGPRLWRLLAYSVVSRAST